MKKLLFVVTEMRLGGRERVVGEIADAVGIQYDTKIFSVWKKKPFFQTSTDVVYGVSNLKVSKRKNSNVLIDKVKNNIIFPIIKFAANYATLQSSRIEELIKYIDENRITTVILTDLTITFASRIKKSCPDVQVIGWVHMQADAFFEKQYKGFKKELKKNFNFLDELVCLTDKQSADYGVYMDSDKIFTIYNPMPTKSTQISSLNNKSICVVSRIDVAHKGLDYLVNYAQRLPDDWLIKIAGNGTPDDEKKFKDLIKKAHVEKKIKWINAIDGTKLSEFYGNSSIFLMTSRFEGFPMTLGEAMSHGLPIVAFDIDGTNVILEDGKYGLLVSAFDIDELECKINELIEEDALRKKYANLSLERIQRFSIAKIVESWKSILK